jgi:hypothetical protein
MSSTIFWKSEIDYIRMEKNASYEEPLQSGVAETRHKPITMSAAAGDLLAK